MTLQKIQTEIRRSEALNWQSSSDVDGHINTNYVLEAKLDLSLQFFREDANSPYANIIVGVKK